MYPFPLTIHSPLMSVFWKKWHGNCRSEDSTTEKLILRHIRAPYPTHHSPFVQIGTNQIGFIDVDEGIGTIPEAF